MDLKNLIDNAQKLPNIPKVVQELIESFGDENINNEAIAKKIQLFIIALFLHWHT